MLPHLWWRFAEEGEPESQTAFAPRPNENILSANLRNFMPPRYSSANLRTSGAYGLTAPMENPLNYKGLEFLEFYYSMVALWMRDPPSSDSERTEWMQKFVNAVRERHIRQMLRQREPLDLKEALKLYQEYVVSEEVKRLLALQLLAVMELKEGSIRARAAQHARSHKHNMGVSALNDASENEFFL